ncbi:MAG TPA: protein kinase [Bryobacteraceae bacterium]|jgi:Tol biopolymer transport system component/predicted Ser/Thr protein kinase|nr:protein kinase [Bryobacteraceae bacterium]
MSVSAGDRLGPYEILAPIGAGGMGQVWKARDPRLDRIVAIKVSREQFSERFELEARAVAALNHPHICQLYDVGPDYLVMEFVDGAPLKGPLPLEKAVDYAAQILDALDAAHQKGITHRDLKPANILLAKQGIKLLDFGLAKRTPRLNEQDPTKALTDQGQILGTLQYMSPEQLQGKEVDPRSDLFSFGCVLYEMLTGKRAFEGQSAASVIAAILEREPAPLTVAPRLERIVRRSLAKDPDQRFQTARDLKAALLWAMEQPPAAAANQPRSRLPWVAAGVLMAALAGLTGLYWRATRPPDRPLMRLSVDLGPEAVAGQFTTASISPDGARLVFPIKTPAGEQMLATRLLSEAKPTVLSGTENGRDPFFSPDGTWIGFFADGKMKKISVHGGAPIVLCDAPIGRGATWGDDGNILAALNIQGALSRVPAEGGTPQPVTKLQTGVGSQRWPQLLPGNESVLLTASGSMIAFEGANIAAVSLKTGDTKILVRGGYFGRYLATGDATGHLVYAHEGVLFAVPFNPARLELHGAAVPILEDLAADPNSGAGQFSFSVAPSGATFVYRSGRVSEQSWPVSWLDHSGTHPLIPTPGFYLQPHFSPDGQQLALVKIDRTDRDAFVYDMQRDRMTRLTVGFQAAKPIWSPDGKHIVFGFISGSTGLGWVRADGAGEIQRLLNTNNIVIAYSFFPDGRRLAYWGVDANGLSKIWTLALDVSDPDHPKPGKPDLFLNTQASERYPAVSPGGQWIAYESDESGKYEVYVRPFPIPPGGAGGKWQISTTGGALPIWSHHSRELFFQNQDHRIMVTDYELKNESFVPGKPRLWSDQRVRDLGGIPNYDLAPDGKRFAIFPELEMSEEKGNVHITFLENFFDELRRRAPARE